MKLIRNLIIVLLLLGGFMFVKYFRVEGMEQLSLRPRGAVGSFSPNLLDWVQMPSWLSPSATSSLSSDEPEPLSFPGEASFQNVSARTRRVSTVRIASFNLHEFGRDKVNDAGVMDMVTRLIRNFDLVALQELDASRRDILPKIVDHLNRTGRSFDYIAGPEVGPIGYTQRLAFVYDKSRIDADRKQTYTVNDPADQIAYEPLVGWFRTQGVPAGSAWTFSMANVYIDPDNADRERSNISGLFKAIARDGRGEDDIILAGCFFGNDRVLRNFAPPNTTFALESTPSDIYARRQSTNLIFDGANTSEFRGNSGAIDFLRQYNMTIAEAEEISDEMPVWAEFSSTEDREAL